MLIYKSIKSIFGLLFVSDTSPHRRREQPNGSSFKNFTVLNLCERFRCFVWSSGCCGTTLRMISNFEVHKFETWPQWPFLRTPSADTLNLLQPLNTPLSAAAFQDQWPKSFSVTFEQKLKSSDSGLICEVILESTTKEFGLEEGKRLFWN